MVGGLHQLIAQVPFGNRQHAAQEFMNIAPDISVKWNSRNIFIFPRNADIITSFKLSMHVGAAPNGYRWKQRWPYFFIKNMKLSIGGQEIWTTNSATLQMQYLIHGSREAAPECIFDLNETERTERSSEAHDILFEPIRLSEVALGQYNIPLIRLAFHEVRLEFESGRLEDCIEPIHPERTQEPLPADQRTNELLEEVEVLGSYTYLDTEERRELAQQPQLTNRTRHFQYKSEIVLTRERQIIDYQSNGICSAAYVWITDVHGNEIPQQVLSKIEPRLNGQTRQVLRGFHSRHAVVNELPHPIIENTKSKNLYYLSYFPGRVEADGFEQGINFRRIERYEIAFTFETNAPEQLLIHTLHRTQNEILYMQGMAGLIDGNVEIKSDQKLSQMQFENPEKQILISPGDEKQCMITYVDFEEGQLVDQCRQCHKIFTKDALFNWLKTRREDQWKCIHCQGPYGRQYFDRGKIHILQEDITGVQEEQVPVANHKQQGILERII